MRNRIFFIIFFSTVIFSTSNIEANVPISISTFHSISLYWSPSNGKSNLRVLLKFREEGSIDWKVGYPMKYNPIEVTKRDLADYRGSLVNLIPNTTYQIELTLEGTSKKDTIFAKTWTEDFPIAKTIKVKNQETDLIVLEGGSKDGYVLYDGLGTTIDVGDSSDYCIYIPRSYVIIRGFKLKNAKKSAIFLRNCNNVIIENCDISSGWGEQDKTGYGKDYQAGIFSVYPTVKSIVVQRCKIHNPRWDSNSWSEKNGDSYHPSGPQAIALYNSAGNHVFRYNTIWTDKEHMFNDIIGHGDNNSYMGFPNCDSDIYGNYLSNSWDDGIESEGANRNVRIWGNYIEKVLIPIANAVVTVGPLYVWRNISGKTFGKYSAFIKMGYVTDPSNMRGYSYIFNNTILQPNGYKGLGKDSRVIRHCVTRNNILHVGHGKNSISTGSRNLDYNFDFDLCSGKYPNDQETHGVKGTPIYIDNAKFDKENMTDNHFLKNNSPGYDAGVIIPNFTDNYFGNAPDIGALEAGGDPMEFGASAYLVTGVDNRTSMGTVVPNSSYLLQNYPNPFNPATTIEYKIPHSGFVRVNVTNFLGQKIVTLVNEYKSEGNYTIKFNPIDEGLGLSTGL